MRRTLFLHCKSTNVIFQFIYIAPEDGNTRRNTDDSQSTPTSTPEWKHMPLMIALLVGGGIIFLISVILAVFISRKISYKRSGKKKEAYGKYNYCWYPLYTLF